ncbi:hypothetical protein JTB14_010195 [Gonioctena quinquepunctata]|nr:hypothetical protein JTB14_010195 [Gonioctena quinquepunctata]
MGEVDKLDFLITIYRTFMRSKSWTLRMFTHGIDLACANGWLEYTKNAKLLGIQKKYILDLLAFRAYVAEALIKADKPVMKRKGRPSSEQNSRGSTPTTSKRPRAETRPISDVRFDNIGPFPSIDGKSYASRCKNPECKGQSHVMCVKFIYVFRNIKTVLCNIT